MNKNHIKILVGTGHISFMRDQVDKEIWPRYAMVCSEEQYTEEILASTLPHLKNLSPVDLCFRRAVSLVTSSAPFIIVENPSDPKVYESLGRAYGYEVEKILHKFE